LTSDYYILLFNSTSFRALGITYHVPVFDVRLICLGYQIFADIYHILVDLDLVEL